MKKQYYKENNESLINKIDNLQEQVAELQLENDMLQRKLNELRDDNVPAIDED